MRSLTFRRLGRTAELSYDGKYALGAWGYMTSLNDLSQMDSGNPMKQNGAYGLYMLAEQKVYHEGDDLGLGPRLASSRDLWPHYLARRGG